MCESQSRFASKAAQINLSLAMMLYLHSWTPATPLLSTRNLRKWPAIASAGGGAPLKFALLYAPIRRFPFASASSNPYESGTVEGSTFDRAAYEAERLRLDAAARDSMAAMASASEGSEDAGSWKWRIRKRIWDLMEAEDIARNPRPVHHRIPNFVGAPKAAESLGRLEVFQKAECVKVNPDSPQKQGFAELEYGMLRHMEAVDDSTLVVTSVHEKQLVDDIPVEKLLIHDVPVDIICTPTKVIYTNTTIPKPQGIYWDKLSPEKLSQIRVLRELKKRIEKETGQVLPSGPSEKLPPTAQRRKPM